jgi:hypothetical protein
MSFPEVLSYEKGVDMEKQRKTGRFPDKVRERAVRGMALIQRAARTTQGGGRTRGVRPQVDERS